MVKSYLVIADSGFGGTSLAYNITTKVSDNVIWFPSENPLIVQRIIDAYRKRPNLEIFSSRKFNIANLNEINILLSKSIETRREPSSVCITLISELILVHGLEKTYLFLANLMNKVEGKNGTVVGLMIKGAQPRRDEILISRLFSEIFHLEKELNDNQLTFILKSETPIDEKYVFRLRVRGYEVELDSVLEKYIKEK
ncbi:hypothetical protein GAH_01756 [Geoglobus ahangari]|uniref:KaiC-like domain-containing protein n=1 Tax=Geoglobus ahangari TaxID=113653 RepID=A0A0F7IDH6_9EURY|nr:hypothetical protein [Geoglobus ahangari]AKG90965.1 hypothetical protein GAH_01756 [Geoglobus ahangari]